MLFFKNKETDIYGVVCVNMSCISSVDSRNHKMLHAYTQSVLFCLDRHADVPASAITVACYGAALQHHLPHAIALLGRNLSWEIWSESGKFQPLFEMHLSKKIDKRTGNVDDFFRDIGVRADRRFICIVDLDVHVQPHVLRSRNEQGVKPTVESENLFYTGITQRYADVCVRASKTAHIMAVSIPFRAPWLTADFEANKAQAVWIDKDEKMVYPKLQTFKQFCTRPRSTEVRGLFMCDGSGVEYETVDWKGIDREMAAYNAGREFRDANVFKDFVEHYQRCSAQRQDLFEDEPAFLKRWRLQFMRNSLDYVSCGPDDTEQPAKRTKLVRFDVADA
jgi:hypothetical protein